MQLSGYRSMWLITMFDLPTDTPAARREYSKFRHMLLLSGFSMMQYSVYSRHCSSKENAETYVRRIERQLPPDGQVRVLRITDKQFERMKVFWGKARLPTESPPAQLEFF